MEKRSGFITSRGTLHPKVSLNLSTAGNAMAEMQPTEDAASLDFSTAEAQSTILCPEWDKNKPFLLQTTSLLFL